MGICLIKVLTGTLNHDAIWFALSWFRLSEFVTNTIGAWTSPFSSCSKYLKAFCAAGIARVPLAKTPSTSKQIPKRGWKETNMAIWLYGKKLSFEIRQTRNLDYVTILPIVFKHIFLFSLLFRLVTPVTLYHVSFVLHKLKSSQKVYS